MKKIIAAALSVLLGTVGLTVVDKTIESRVATLESEVVELREEVSKNENNGNHTNSQIKTIEIGQVISKESNSHSEFLLRKYSDGRIQIINKSDSYTEQFNLPSLVFEEFVVYIDNSDASVTTIKNNEIIISFHCIGHTDPVFAGKQLKLGISGLGYNSEEITMNTINSDGTFEYQVYFSCYHNSASSLWYVPSYSIYNLVLL